MHGRLNEFLMEDLVSFSLDLMSGRKRWLITPQPQVTDEQFPPERKTPGKAVSKRAKGDLFIIFRTGTNLQSRTFSMFIVCSHTM